MVINRETGEKLPTVRGNVLKMMFNDAHLITRKGRQGSSSNSHKGLVSLHTGEYFLMKRIILDRK